MLAHGDEELRNKADNLYQFNPSFEPLKLFRERLSSVDDRDTCALM